MTNSTTLKRLFKARYGIPVRVQNGKRYCVVWIPMDKRERHTDPMTYSHRFPDALGNHCMRLVYQGHSSLEAQNWGGSIGTHSIGMTYAHWEALLAEWAAEQEQAVAGLQVLLAQS